KISKLPKFSLRQDVERFCGRQGTRHSHVAYYRNVNLVGVHPTRKSSRIEIRARRKYEHPRAIPDFVFLFIMSFRHCLIPASVTSLATPLIPDNQLASRQGAAPVAVGE